MNKAQDSQAVAMEVAAEGQTVSVTRWKFNFGPDSGRADETGDHLQVTATTAYEERGAYGFEAGSLVYEKQRIGDDDVPNSTKQYHNNPGQTTMSARLRSGFCIPLKASFIVDVPDGTY